MAAKPVKTRAPEIGNPLYYDLALTAASIGGNCPIQAVPHPVRILVDADVEVIPSARILNDSLREAGVQVFFGQRLAGIRKKSGRILELRTLGGKEFAAPVYIDSSYEGDLMKAAGVSYAVGRESRSLYGESLAGRQDFLPGSAPVPAGVDVAALRRRLAAQNQILCLHR